MDIQQLLNEKNTGKISLQVTAQDLHNFAKIIAEQTANQAPNPETPDNKDKLLTPAEVCERLSVARQTLYKWREKKWLVPLKMGYSIRYRESDIEAILTNGLSLKS